MRHKWVTIRALMIVMLFAAIGLLLGSGFTLNLSAATSPSQKKVSPGRLSDSGCPSCGSPKFTR